jgi:nitrite reductase (NO-forming)/hydroxylamine reductase
MAKTTTRSPRAARRTALAGTAAAALAAFACGGDGRHETSDAAPDRPDAASPDATPPELTCADAPLPAFAGGEATWRGFCAGCHTVGEGPQRAPDLKGVHLRRTRMWLTHWLFDPAAMAATDPEVQAMVDEWGYLMPASGLDGPGANAVLDFMEAHDASGVTPRPPMTLSDSQFDEAARIYFDRCAGCHGTYRGGATGPALPPVRAQALGTDSLAATLYHGTPRGMPAWGKEQILDPGQIECLAAFLQLAPPAAPPRSLEEIRASWQLLVPPAARPTAPEHGRDWENFFGVVLRDPGEVAIFDGDSREELARIDTGFAVHILRASATGRYFHAVGRDGVVTMIDLWADPPQAVARVQGCYDSRSVEASKLDGWQDRFVIQGCYWPPQYVVYDGLTLEPLARQDVPRHAVDTGEELDEVRVAAIAASPFEPTWVLALKESGYVGLVDYSLPDFPLAAEIPAVRFLHDGGWDHTGRYVLVAANANDRIVVVDAAERSVIAQIPTGDTPHPGRGANWEDPVYGWVNATTHIGEGKLTVYGADPAGRPEHAWQVVRELPLDAAGGLFLKTHPASPWVLVDMPLANEPDAARQICAYAKAEGVIDRCITPSTLGRAVHFEFDRTGSELWVSVWDEEGEIVVYDAVTLDELARIPGLETPTGKFNVYNTAHDVY